MLSGSSLRRRDIRSSCWPLPRFPGLVQGLVRTSMFAPGHRAVSAVLGALGPVCLPRLPQLNVTHEGKCWGRGQWRSGLEGAPSPQGPLARYCLYGGRAHPAATLRSPVSSCAVPFLPATLFSLCPASAPCHLCHPLAPASFCPGFIISSCLSLLSLWGFGSPGSIIALHPAHSLLSPLPRSHQIDSRPRLGLAPDGL